MEQKAQSIFIRMFEMLHIERWSKLTTDSRHNQISHWKVTNKVGRIYPGNYNIIIICARDYTLSALLVYNLDLHLSTKMLPLSWISVFPQLHPKVVEGVSLSNHYPLYSCWQLELVEIEARKESPLDASLQSLPVLTLQS